MAVTPADHEAMPRWPKMRKLAAEPGGKCSTFRLPMPFASTIISWRLKQFAFLFGQRGIASWPVSRPDLMVAGNKCALMQSYLVGGLINI